MARKAPDCSYYSMNPWMPQWQRNVVMLEYFAISNRKLRLSVHKLIRKKPPPFKPLFVYRPIIWA